MQYSRFMHLEDALAAVDQLLGDDHLAAPVRAASRARA